MIKILHLYADLLNLYGEYGNVTILKKHLEDQKEEVSVYKAGLFEEIDFNEYDFIYSGSGLESNLKVALKDIKRHKKSLVEAINHNKFILFTGNSYELLANKVDEEEGLKITDMEVKHLDKRISGDVIVKNKIFGELVGFINKSSQISSKEKGIFEYVFKDEGLIGESDSEGYLQNNFLATELIGPILVKNPNVLDFFVEGLCPDMKQLDYFYERKAYAVTLEALKQRIK